MSKGVLLFCFDTEHTRYHRILERCVRLVRKNISDQITVVTDFHTYQRMSPMGHINYRFIEPELGNKKNGQEWRNVDRHMAYDGHLFRADADTICLVRTLKESQDTFCVLDTNHNPVEITNPAEFLGKLIERNQESLNAYKQIYQTFTRKG